MAKLKRQHYTVSLIDSQWLLVYVDPHTRRRRPTLGFLEQVGPNFVGPSSAQLYQHFITVHTNSWSRFADNETRFAMAANWCNFPQKP